MSILMPKTVYARLTIALPQVKTAEIPDTEYVEEHKNDPEIQKIIDLIVKRGKQHFIYSVLCSLVSSLVLRE